MFEMNVHSFSDKERVDKSREDKEACSSLIESRAPGYGIAIAVDNNCDDYSIAMVAIDSSIESLRLLLSIGMIGRQSGSQQRCWNGHPAGAI